MFHTVDEVMQSVVCNTESWSRHKIRALSMSLQICSEHDGFIAQRAKCTEIFDPQRSVQPRAFYFRSTFSPGRENLLHGTRSIVGLGDGEGDDIGGAPYWLIIGTCFGQQVVKSNLMCPSYFQLVASFRLGTLAIDFGTVP